MGEDLFGAWGLTWTCVPAWAILNALLAFPALVWRQSRRKEMVASVLVWTVFTAAYVAYGAVLYVTNLNDPGWRHELAARDASSALAMGMALDFLVFVAIPQAGALVVSRFLEPVTRPIFAAVFTLFGLFVYVAGGVLTGATPD